MSGTVLYDADCEFCTSIVRRMERVLVRRRFELRPLETAANEMQLRLEDGSLYGGADAIVEIARRIWWTWPLWGLSRAPGVMPTMLGVYRWIARHRGCASGTCRREE